MIMQSLADSEFSFGCLVFNARILLNGVQNIYRIDFYRLLDIFFELFDMVKYKEY